MSYWSDRHIDGICGHINPVSGYVCTLEDGSHTQHEGESLHRCVTPTKDPDGLCTGEWTESDPAVSGLPEGCEPDFLCPPGGIESLPLGIPPEEMTDLVMRSAQLSVAVDLEVERWQNNPHPDDVKLLAFTNVYGSEQSREQLADLLAVAVSKLAESQACAAT